MMNYLYRVCWNSFGWTRLAGVCAQEEGFPMSCEFGHEEWNLDKDASVDGYVYGYAYELPADMKSNPHTTRIAFWAADPAGSKKVLVGLYLEAEPSLLSSNAQLRLKVDKAFESKGVYQRRADELYRLHGIHHHSMCLEGTGLRFKPGEYTYEEALAVVRSAVLKGYLLWRCPERAVISVDEKPPLPKSIGGKSPTYRFTTFLAVSESSFDSMLRQTGLSHLTEAKHAAVAPRAGTAGFPGRGGMGGRTPGGRTMPHILENYPRLSPQSYKIIAPQHRALTNGLFAWLKNRGIKATMERNYIDLSFDSKNHAYMVESKVTAGESTTRAIREALGQVMEYNLYPGRERADRWIILLNTEPEPEDKEFAQNLRNGLRIPLYLAWQKEDGDFDFYDPENDLSFR